MSNNFTIRTKILKPVAEVFSAVTSKEYMEKYFTDRMSADLAEGERVIWNWEDYGDHPVTVKVIEPNNLIVLELNSQEWGKTVSDAYPVTVTMEFEALDEGSTMLSISESGWKIEEEDGRKGSYDNCGGWQHMAMCLKAYLEYGIDLR